MSAGRRRTAPRRRSRASIRMSRSSRSTVRLDASNARAIVARFDVVLDGSDNFATRYALSDACYFERRPLVSAALGEFDGTLTTLKPYEAGPDGEPNPTYRCLFPDPPEPGTIPTCAEAGVLGALGGVLGSLMALEAIREIVGGFGDGDARPRRPAPDDRRARRCASRRCATAGTRPIRSSGARSRRRRSRPRPTPSSKPRRRRRTNRRYSRRRQGRSARTGRSRPARPRRSC